jgi:hypothetical protein
MALRLLLEHALKESSEIKNTINHSQVEGSVANDCP